jgi:hypothetical protein
VTGEFYLVDRVNKIMVQLDDEPVSVSIMSDEDDGWLTVPLEVSVGVMNN